jgi:YfiH family protein
MVNNDALLLHFSDRWGGVSPEPYDSMNLAYHVGDDPTWVDQNRIRMKEKIACDSIAVMEQVHGCDVKVVEQGGNAGACDAIVTNQKGIVLMVMVADCIPILMVDRKKSVVAAVHAGRNGTFLNIASRCVETMVEQFDVVACDLEVHFGPAIGACCYEVGEELVQIARKNFGKHYINNERYLDLKQLNTDLLRAAGVVDIRVSATCTCCNKDYFSYRREGTTGRFAGFIGLRAD